MIPASEKSYFPQRCPPMLHDRSLRLLDIGHQIGFPVCEENDPTDPSRKDEATFRPEASEEMD